MPEFSLVHKYWAELNRVWRGQQCDIGTDALTECKQTQPRSAAGSDSASEFSEGSREPVLRVDVETEFVVAAAEALQKA